MISPTFFIIRVDSSTEIGTGHLARCLVLAGKLSKRGAEIVFICRAHTGSRHDLILDQGFKLHLLSGVQKPTTSSNPADWLGCSQLQDASETAAILYQYSGAHVIVDHYGLDAAWETYIQCKSVIVIDDLANRRHQCNVLIDQSLINKKVNYESLIDGDFEFIGGSTIILREEFTGKKNWAPPKTGRLLICMGGTDPGNYTSMFLEQLIVGHRQCPTLQAVTEIVAILGAATHDHGELRALSKSKDINVSIVRNSCEISKKMLTSDLCLLSCGTLILEACALGVPSVGVAMADNQLRTAQFLAEAGAIELYERDNAAGVALYEIVVCMLRDSARRSLAGQKSKQMVNYAGGDIIAEKLCDL